MYRNDSCCVDKEFPLIAGRVDRRRGKWPGSRVRLFEVEPELIANHPSEVRDRLTREVTVPVRVLPPGPWTPAIRESEALLAFLVIDGPLSRETRLFGERAVELLGPGDPFRPTEGLGPTTLPYEPSWKVVAESKVAILDADFEGKLRWMPDIAGQLVARTREAVGTMACQLAITGIRDLAARLLVMLWHLADRWGRRERGSVVLTVPLPHGLLADLVRAERESVTRRLRVLRERGLVERRPDGLWVLHGGPPTALEHLEAAVADKALELQGEK